MNDPVAREAEHRYRLLRIALERFGREPTELDAGQQQQAERIASRQLEIEDAVLRSPEALGVVIPDSQVEAAWQQVCARYEDEEALARALEMQQLEAERVRYLLARDLKVEAVMERASLGLPEISETDVSLYYFSHPEQFERPETRLARHILITINEDFPENTRETALARLQTIAQRLAQKPERFAEQATKHSECPTALQGGQLGEVRRGTLYPTLEACLFELEPGQTSTPVESPLGFHLLRCDAVNRGGHLALEEVMPRLRQWLQARQRQARQREWLERLLKQSAPKEEPAHG